MLVAAANLHDPDFAHAVILLVHSDAQGAIGFMLNRPIGTTGDFAGGPVRLGTNALLRSHDRGTPGLRLLEDVYLLADKAAQANARRAGFDSTRLRVYAGYCGWSAPQLQAEIETKRWRVLDGSVDIVFDPNVASLWQRLRARTR